MALADYDRAIELDPDLAQAYYNRGNTYAELQEHAAALADYDRATELDPDLAQAYYSKACAFALQVNTQAASEWLKQSRALDD